MKSEVYSGTLYETFFKEFVSSQKFISSSAVTSCRSFPGEILIIGFPMHASVTNNQSMVTMCYEISILSGFMDDLGFIEIVR